MYMQFRNFFFAAALLMITGMLAACSGGGSDGSTSTTVSGVVMAGPANGTKVKAKNILGTYSTTSSPTNSKGEFSLTLPNSVLASDLVFETVGGTFHDEATNTTGIAMGKLTAHFTAGSITAGTNLTIDPASTIIQKLIAGGQGSAAAFTSYSSTFGYKPDFKVKPAFANVSSAASRQERLSGLRTAAFSQMASNLSVQAASQFDLISAIAADMSDGTMAGGYVVDGKTIPADIANRYGEALITYQQSPNNKSKLKADQIGAPLFHKTAYTSSYKVEYLPGTMAAATGKTTFKIRLTNLADGSAASGRAVTLRPYMYMSTKSHSTPMEAVIDNGDGTYSCTVYYVMSTAMAGVSMGVWELKVTVDGTEFVKFFPTVGMPMGGTTTLAKLLGVIDNTDPFNPIDTDSIMGLTAKEARTWFLFNDGLSGMAGNNTFKIFLATKEMNAGLTFPAVKAGDTFLNQLGAAWTVNSIDIEASTDKATWNAAVDSGNGHWTIAGLPGLTSGTAGKIYVRLKVNTLLKTTDNLPLKTDGTNGYQTFTVTPM